MNGGIIGGQDFLVSNFRRQDGIWSIEDVANNTKRIRDDLAPIVYYDFYRQYRETGASQTAIDYSGNDAHGVLGSTSGTDSYDPPWTSEGLYFGGSHYLNGRCFDLGSNTIYTVFKMPSSLSLTYSSIWGRNNAALYWTRATGRVTLMTQITPSTPYDFQSDTVGNLNTWYLARARIYQPYGTGNAQGSVSISGHGTITSASGTLCNVLEQYNSLGRHATYWGNLTIAMHLVYCDVHTNDEVDYISRQIKSLFSKRGISIA